MGTDKRARQKELHRTRAEQAAKAAAAADRRKKFVSIGLVAVLVAGVVGVVTLLGGDEEQTASDTTTTTAPGEAPDTSAAGSEAATLTGPGAGEAVTGETPCPEADGSSPRTTSFEQAPPTCIDESKTYTAIFDTTEGSFTATLDAQAAPITVNNFVVLARYRYFDGIPFHRIVPGFVIQAGDPSDTPDGTGGPGYTIGEEPPADKTYEKYDLAMAKTAEPNSTGSQFFVVTGDPSALNSAGTYSLFGRVTAGTEVVDAIGSSPTAGPSGDSPTKQITINSITIAES